jgi:hypothetical protein
MQHMVNMLPDGRPAKPDVVMMAEALISEAVVQAAWLTAALMVRRVESMPTWWHRDS